MKTMSKISINDIGKILIILLIITTLSVVSYWIIDNFIFYFNIDSNLLLHHIYDNKFYIGDRICSGGTRFLPFQYVDYNILRLFSRDIRANLMPYYIVLRLFLSVFLFVYIIKDFEKFNKVKLNFYISVLTILFFFIFSATIMITMSVVYAELTCGIFCLLFILFYQRAYFTNKLKYYVMAILTCVYATYMKETMFIPFLVIGFANLLFLDGKKNKLRGGGISYLF